MPPGESHVNVAENDSVITPHRFEIRFHLLHLLTQDRLVTPCTGHSPALCLGVPSIPALRAFALPFPTFRCGVVLIPRNRYVRSTGRTGYSRMSRCRFPFMTALRTGYELLLDLVHVHPFR